MLKVTCLKNHFLSATIYPHQRAIVVEKESYPAAPEVINYVLVLVSKLHLLLNTNLDLYLNLQIYVFSEQRVVSKHIQRHRNG